MSTSPPGHPVTPTNVEDYLREAARHLSGPYKRDSESWGIPATYGLIDQADAPLKQAIERVLGDFLVSGTPDEARLAATVADELDIDPSKFSRALTRSDLSENSVERLRNHYSKAAARGRIPHQADFRNQLGQPGYKPLLGAIIAYDHDWFLDHLSDVLTNDPDRAANRLWFGITELNRAEAEALRDELQARVDELGGDLVSSMVEVIDDEIADGRYNDRPGPIRWS